MLAGSVTPGSRAANEIAAANVGVDGFVESSPSEERQQVSASTCVKAVPESACDSRLCIGQSPSAQQAMRSSGVAAQPAHIAAAFPVVKLRQSRTAERR